MAKYGKKEATYWIGIVDGLNIAYKVINKTDDDYNYIEIFGK